MNEVKTPKKPLINFWIIALLILLGLNFMLVPYLQKAQIKEENYSAFLNQVEKENVDKVQVDDDKITYTLKGSEQL